MYRLIKACVEFSATAADVTFAGAGARPGAERSKPQFLQKRAPAETGWLQLGQERSSDLPQFSQNFASRAFSNEQD
jgi:hypothetical protein